MDEQPEVSGQEGPSSVERQRLLRGVVDLHIHSGPDIFPRIVTAPEAAVAAKKAGMAGLLLKSHSTDTAARAELVRGETGLAVYGGVVLNYPVGGLNPHAVVETVRQGGRCVWMPTISARNFVAHSSMAPMLQQAIPPNVRGIVAAYRGRLLPAVARILDVIAEHQILLCGGHLTGDELNVLFTEARARGIRRMVVNHAEAPFMGLRIEDIRRLAALGAYIELTKMGSISDRARIIREVGVRHCFIATDSGPTRDPAPVDLMYQTLKGLEDLGFSATELRYLSVEVPAYLLGLTDEVPALA